MTSQQSLISLILSALFTATACSAEVNKHDSLTHKQEVNIYPKINGTNYADDNLYSIPDSINFDCILNLACMSDGWRISECNLILNNDNDILNVTGWFPHKQVLKFKLKKPVADCFKQLLYEIYSEHNSALKDGLSSDTDFRTSVQDDLSIKIKIGNNHFKEFFYVDCLILKYQEEEENIYPFRSQFKRIDSLLYAILSKVNDEYSRPKRQSDAPDWIVDDFNYDYYEPITGE